MNLKDIGATIKSAQNSVQETESLVSIWKVAGVAFCVALFFTWNKYLR